MKTYELEVIKTNQRYTLFIEADNAEDAVVKAKSMTPAPKKDNDEVIELRVVGLESHNDSLEEIYQKLNN